MQLQAKQTTLMKHSSEPHVKVRVELPDGQVFKQELSQLEVSIGRAKDNDIVLRDIFVSRHHAHLKLNEDQSFTLRAHKDYNGLVVDGEELPQIRLENGQSLKIGKSYLSFSLKSHDLSENTQIDRASAASISLQGEYERTPEQDSNAQILTETPPATDLRAQLESDTEGKTETLVSQEPAPETQDDEDKEDNPATVRLDSLNFNQEVAPEEEAKLEHPWGDASPLDDAQTQIDDPSLEVDEDEDLPPAYSLKKRLFYRENKVFKGEKAWEVIRYRGEQIYDISPLRAQKSLKLGIKEGPTLKVDKNGNLLLSKFNGNLSRDIEGDNFEHASSILRHNMFGWANSPANLFRIEHEGVFYLVREIRIPEVKLPDIELEVPDKYYYISGGIALFHMLLLLMLSFMPSTPKPIPTEPKEDLNRFAEVTMRVEQPKPKPKPKPKVKPPKPKKVTTKVSKRKTKKVSRSKKRFKSKRPPKQTSKKVADISQMGALGKLGGTGAFSKTISASNQLLAAASNVTAVRAKGGAQTVSVTGNIAGMPGKEIRMASISPVGKIGGSPKGDGFGAASVGAKTQRKIKGTVIDLSPPSGEVGVRGGGLSRAEIAKVVQQHLSEIRYCYEKGLLDDPSLSGKIVAKWTIAPQGSVSQTGIKSSSVRNAGVHGCLTGQIRSWGFPKPRNGGSVLVTFPFVFSASSF